MNLCHLGKQQVLLPAQPSLALPKISDGLVTGGNASEPLLLAHVLWRDAADLRGWGWTRPPNNGKVHGALDLVSVRTECTLGYEVHYIVSTGM